jgi:serine protease
MRRFRVLGASSTVAIAVALVLRANGQGVLSPRTIIDHFAPPAIENGIRPDLSRAPDSPETRQRRSLRRASGPADRVGSSGRPYVAGRVIVKFRDGASAESRIGDLAAASRTARMGNRPTYADFDVVSIDPNEDAEAVATALSARPDVEYAQPSYRMRPKFRPNDRFYDEQWNLPIIGMEQAWDIQPAAGSSITVAVLDTGVAYANQTFRFRAQSFSIDNDGNIGAPDAPGTTVYPALGDLTLSFVAATELGPSTRFVSPHDFIWEDDMPVDLDGHGTHVSGTIGQLTNNGTNGSGDAKNGGGTAGIAFNVKIMPVKVISTEWDDIFLSPNVGTDDVVARGIRYAADNGAKVINMSFGEIGSSSSVLESAMRYAVGKGVFMAISAGNEFEDGNPVEIPASLASKIDGAVSVAAIDRAKNHAFYSNTGSWVELSAPGGSFRGFDKTGGVLQQTLDLAVSETFTLSPAQFSAPRFDALAYYYFTGTSMAAPHVSGVAAMLMQQGITDPAAVEAALEKFADDLGTPGRDDTFGYGLVNARRTLLGLGLAK